MKFSPTFKPLLRTRNAKETFDLLVNTLTDSIKSWDYFVNWTKVLGNAREYEVDLNTMNYLVGKDDVAQEFRYLLKRQNSLVRVVPLLIAARDEEFKILTDPERFVYETFRFDSKAALNDDEIEAVVRFCDKVGILALFQQRALKSLWDYVVGVEVGLDTNARKNRSGTSMERLLEGLIKRMCEASAVEYIPQATQKKVKARWGVTIPVRKKSPTYDFAVKNGNRIYLIETNYYGGGGSKLKSTAGEYRDVSDRLKKAGFGFIWVTDGQGWKSTLNDLRDTFDYNDYTLNLHFVRSGLLAHIITKKL